MNGQVNSKFLAEGRPHGEEIFMAEGVFCAGEYTDRYGCENYKECKLVNNETIECRDKTKGCMTNYFFNECYHRGSKNVSVCTNNLSYTYCDGDPESCYEKYSLPSFAFADCVNITIKYLIENGYVFECIEWENTLIQVTEENICFLESTAYSADMYLMNNSIHVIGESAMEINCSGVTPVSVIATCTKSRLTCHGSVEECKERYRA
jgi:hypothetical protein